MTNANVSKIQKDSKTSVKAIINNEDLTKSAKMRQLYDLGKDLAEIAKLVNVRYQFVWNVIDIHTNGEIRESSNKSTKSDEFRKLFKEGKTCAQIAKITNSNNNFVNSVIKKYKRQLTK